MMNTTGQERYLYCIADASEKTSLGAMGLRGQEVYTIPHQEICAVVHDCPTDPYGVEDQDRLKDWVLAHQKVVETAWERWGAVLPSSLGTVIKGDGKTDAQESLSFWLESHYDKLMERIDKVKGKAEYGVQVFWNPLAQAKAIAEANPQIRMLEERALSSSKGLAYMQRQQLESLLKREVQAQADRCFQDCYDRVKRHVADIRVEKVKSTVTETQMLLNLSCLVAKDKYAKLGEELERIDQAKGLSVRFTGPWPPYSFVG